MTHTVELTDMGERATITIHTSPETRKQLEWLADATRRSKSFLGNEAIERYLAAEVEFVTGILEGIKDADEGRVYTSDEVKDRLRRAIDGVGSNKPGA